ncbi:MAG: hypothetical protein HYY04_13145, partial [Chloroflexi bacterium]|nr:hypothetical protein [Chloroflexota bacterium]
PSPLVGEGVGGEGASSPGGPGPGTAEGGEVPPSPAATEGSPCGTWDRAQERRPGSEVRPGGEVADLSPEEEEARRFAQLKGLSFFDELMPDDGRLEAAPASAAEEDPLAGLDEETRRFAERKGLGLLFTMDGPTVTLPLEASLGEGRDGEERGERREERGALLSPLSSLLPPPSSGGEVLADEEQEASEPGPIPSFFARFPAIVEGLESGRLQQAATALIGLVVATTAFFALAYVNLYSAPHPAVAASDWIYTNVPRGAAIATEHWEEGMPVPLVRGRTALSEQSMQYRKLELKLYEEDTPQKLQHIVQQLRGADYVVFFSNRLYGTIPRLPNRYPMTSEYYRLLFGEQLGFELVGAFTSYPNLLDLSFVDDTLADPGLPTPALLQHQPRRALTINMGHADESFSVYDHPRVLVFKKTRPLPDEQVRALLEPTLVRVRPPGSLASAGREFRSLLLAPAQQAMVRAGGTYRALFNPTGLENQVPLLVWIVLVEAVGWAAVPLAFVVFRNLADRGYVLAKTLGLLALAWVSWMVVSVGLAPSTRLTVFGAFIVLLALSGAIFYRQRTSMLGFWRERLRLLVIGEAVFWAAFIFFLFVRASNPDLWHPARGGEKPMDLAYLTAVIRSPVYPPYDPWFAGGYLNYYYYGQLIAGTFIKLSGIVPTTAINLAVPYFTALTFAGAFAVAYNLVRRSPREQLVAGLGAGLFVCVIGNLGGFGQILIQLARLGNLPYRSALPGLGEAVQALAGLVRVIAEPRLFQVPTDWYWASTRVIKDTINEFPYFTFLFADPHAHLYGLPLTALAIAVAVEIVRSGHPFQRVQLPWSNGRLGFAAPAIWAERARMDTIVERIREVSGVVSLQMVATLFVAALTVGALMPTNSWDFPTYLGLTALAMLIPWYLASRPTAIGLALTLLRFAIVAALSVILYLPFHQSFQSFYSGVRPFPDKSNVGAYLAIHGLFVAVMISFILVDVFTRYRRSGWLRELRLGLTYWDRLPRYLRLRQRLVFAVPPLPQRGTGSGTADRGEGTTLLRYGALAILGIIALGALLKATLAGLLLALLVVVVVLALQRDRPAEETFLYGLFGTGLALGIVTELVAIEGDIGRMNTVFKFYLQVWTMWGIGSAVALVLIGRRLLAIRRPTVRRVWVGFLAALLAATFVYPLVATPARVADRFATNVPLTLDGTAYMQYATYVDNNRELRFRTDLAAIRWLQENVEGTPVILEANTPLYRWGSRISIYTGLPTVIGWDWHQKQQRAGYTQLVDERLRDVRTMYTDASSSNTLVLLRRYKVEYIYVGDVERAYYPAPGLAKFDQMVGQSLDLVYDVDGVRIYRVRQAQGAQD